MRHPYPFTAIVGQDRLKTALLLILVDPRIGGLLLSGPRGSAKSTLVRSLVDLNNNQPFVTVPLGASEEMVIGSLDIDKALSDSKLVFKPGLLAKANTGILYIDEANLLTDNLVDLLLDAAASGTNLIERDGISHQHDALFSLVGTMNPDEGELRPQLLDRFGLMAEVDTQFSIQQRQLVVAQRLAFDSTPDAFIARQKPLLKQLQTQLNWAIEYLPKVTVSQAISTQIAQRCADANVEGFRADITLHRASRAYAALQQRLEVLESDVDAVEALVLKHRRNPSTNTPSSTPPNTPPNAPPTTENGSSKPQSGSSIQGSWGAMKAVTTETSAARAVSEVQLERMPKSTKASAIVTKSKYKGHSISQRLIDRVPMRKARVTRKINWFRSLGMKPQKQLSISDLKYRYPQPRRVELSLVLLDTSTSTLSGQGIVHAKGVLKTLSQQAYLKRQHMGILGFGNNKVTTLIHPQPAPKNIQPTLNSIKVGGGTPIRKALDFAQNLLASQRYQHLDCSIYLITDGRLEPSINTHSLLAEHQITLIDIESSHVKLGLGRQLADAISARYWPVSMLPIA